jgi:hypothetical protein
MQNPRAHQNTGDADEAIAREALEEGLRLGRATVVQAADADGKDGEGVVRLKLQELL